MHTISDVIEDYLRGVLSSSPKTYIDIRRKELALRFQCVPSQVNYVIQTRFTLERGYLIKSQRGGGGYIRIIKINLPSKSDFFAQLEGQIGDLVPSNRAKDLIIRLYEEKIVTERERDLMLSVIAKSDINSCEYKLHDEVRAKLLKAMLHALKYHELTEN